jgi:hypothetical protein
MRIILSLVVFSVILVIFSCNKNKFETKPRLEFKSYDKVVDSPGILKFSIKFFDKEGDLGNAPFIAIRQRLNKFPPPPPVLADTFRYPQLPEFPDKDQGEIIFQLDYTRLDESVAQNDTCRFRFAVTDKAGNKSDTLTSDIIVARKPH